MYRSDRLGSLAQPFHSNSICNAFGVVAARTFRHRGVPPAKSYLASLVSLVVVRVLTGSAGVALLPG